jgi:hypothetical protein
LEQAAYKAEEINQALLKELPVSQVQLDEMWSFVTGVLQGRVQYVSGGFDGMLSYAEDLCPHGEAGSSKKADERAVS